MGFYQFSVDDLRTRYGCESDTELAGLLGWTKGSISLWRSKGIPDAYQRFLNIETKIPESRKKPPIPV